MPSETTTDAELVATCAAVLDVPKADPPSSFVLHAPLELLARALLLDLVAPDRRDEARDRLRGLVAEYEAAGAASTTPAPNLPRSADDLVVSLAAAGHAPILLSLRSRVPAVAA